MSRPAPPLALPGWKNDSGSTFPSLSVAARTTPRQERLRVILSGVVFSAIDPTYAEHLEIAVKAGVETLADRARSGRRGIRIEKRLPFEL